MKTEQLREAFLDFFEQQGHQRVPSSSLVPGNDPTLLFTNAGMNQFKDTFLGTDPRPYNRAVSSQRCVRAGGKHNDLENVGYTARHHTFFEMLGNFSFGDYFKREAIRYCWEFLTGTLGLPPERLWVTVHVSDDEAAAIWIDEMGIDPARFSRLDEDNFWQMGDTGPCGPCSEVFYDHGPDIPGGPPGSPGDDLDRYIEVWNLVFMQYNRDSSGTLHPLPRPSVDTGMGLERIAAVMQGVHSNYEIDLFCTLIDAAAAELDVSDRAHASLRVIADHIRSCAFLIVDGVVPGNEGRGYVLRRIIRRAIRHGNKLGARSAFFHKLVPALVEAMGAAYPELAAAEVEVARVLLREEEQFARTLDHGMGVLEGALAELEGSVIPGALVFLLYDTYGFPTDLTNDIARERGLTLDIAGYEAAMAEQRQRSQEAGTFKVDYSAALQLPGSTEFTGYAALEGPARIMALLDGEGRPCETLAPDQAGAVVLDRTPFYAESGGQVGDTGYLTGAGTRFEVSDTRKSGNHHLHQGRLLQGSLRVGDELRAAVDGQVRGDTAVNHSATHLLHAALREVLGPHVTQKGSLVDSRRLRFDFSHSEPVAPAQLQRIEQRVNAQVRANSPVEIAIMDMAAAKDAGAMALFGEKYGDEVRVLTMGGGFSVELCGGTHVQRTGDIGLLRIVSEGGVASGVRRIEAVTGAGALAYIDANEAALRAVCAELRAAPETALARLQALRAEARELEKELARLKQKLASAAGGELADRAVAVDGIKVLAAVLPGADAAALRDTLDRLKNKLGSAVILLAAAEDDKIALVSGVTADLTARVSAGNLMREFAGRLGGKGGGRPDMAQGGGSDVAGLAGVLESLPQWVAGQLQR